MVKLRGEAHEAVTFDSIEVERLVLAFKKPQTISHNSFLVKVELRQLIPVRGPPKGSEEKKTLTTYFLILWWWWGVFTRNGMNHNNSCCTQIMRVCMTLHLMGQTCLNDSWNWSYSCNLVKLFWFLQNINRNHKLDCCKIRKRAKNLTKHYTVCFKICISIHTPKNGDFPPIFGAVIMNMRKKVS